MINSGDAVITEQKGTILNIMRYSTQDGPGLRTTVFFKGCPLKCRWCHNPESQSQNREFIYRRNRCIGCGDCVSVCSYNAIVFKGGFPSIIKDNCVGCNACVEKCSTEARDAFGKVMSVDQVMHEIRKDLPFFEESGGGATFSGGEPLSQPEFLKTLLETCREEYIHTAVDTCGVTAFRHFESIIPFTDLFLYDVKIMDDELHRRETGSSNRQSLENLKKLSERGCQILIRIPLIPGVTDADDNIDSLGDFLVSLRGISGVRILPYHETGKDKFLLLGRDYNMAPTQSPSPQRMEEVSERLRSRGLKVSIGGK